MEPVHSLRSRLLVLWCLLLISAAGTGFLLFAFYRQSAAVQVANADAAVARACRDLSDRYRFFVTGWNGPSASSIDDETKTQLVNAASLALSRFPGVEGGYWQAAAGSLAYAYPTYEGTGPKTDLPMAEHASISQVNAEALRDDRSATIRRSSQSQVLVLEACPLPGPVRGATAWAMTRTFTGQGPALNQLLTGLGLLALTVLGSAFFLGRVLFVFSRRIAKLETALGQQSEDGELPTLATTGQRELDRLVEALNSAGSRLTEARRRAAASEGLAAIGRLAAGVAHEIRNPIGAMRLKAENALRSEDPKRGRDALIAILAQIKRLDTLLRDLLTLAHRHEPRREPVDLPALLQECVSLHEDVAKANRTTIEIEVMNVNREDRPVLDRAQIRRALDNLIVNAIQSASAESDTIVRVRARREGERLYIRVSDTGPGIRPELHEALFEPFVTGRADGTGLGLAIVREIARDHGGEARLVSGQIGAIFEIELPWRPS